MNVLVRFLVENELLLYLPGVVLLVEFLRLSWKKEVRNPRKAFGAAELALGKKVISISEMYASPVNRKLLKAFFYDAAVLRIGYRALFVLMMIAGVLPLLFSISLRTTRFDSVRDEVLVVKHGQMESHFRKLKSRAIALVDTPQGVTRILRDTSWPTVVMVSEDGDPILLHSDDQDESGRAGPALVAFDGRNAGFEVLRTGAGPAVIFTKETGYEATVLTVSALVYAIAVVFGFLSALFLNVVGGKAAMGSGSD